jgi:hypothetical protein
MGVKVGSVILSLLLVGILLGVTHLLHVEECCEETHASTTEQQESADHSEHSCVTCHACHPKVDLKRGLVTATQSARPIERKDLVDSTMHPEIYLEGPAEPPKFLHS